MTPNELALLLVVAAVLAIAYGLIERARRKLWESLDKNSREHIGDLLAERAESDRVTSQRQRDDQVEIAALRAENERLQIRNLALRGRAIDPPPTPIVTYPTPLRPPG